MNFYEVLGIDASADEDGIRLAYRKKAKMHHPDMHSGDAIKIHTEIFKQVQIAYQALSDPAKRAQYDRKHKPAKRPPPPASKKSSAPDPAGIKCSYFGGSSTGQNVLTWLSLSPPEMQAGCVKHIYIKKRDLCSKCVGDGKYQFCCPACLDRNNKRHFCDYCDRQGQITRTCDICKGAGVERWIVVNVKVVVPPNSKIGYSINVLGEGEAAPGKPPGNLRVVIV